MCPNSRIPPKSHLLVIAGTHLTFFKHKKPHPNKKSTQVYQQSYVYILQTEGVKTTLRRVQEGKTH